MRILITGASGFIGKNLVATLENIISGKDKSYGLSGDIILYKYSRNLGIEKLQKFCMDCDFVFFLAGVNRPENPDEYMQGNAGFLECLLKELYQRETPCPIMYASSTQAVLDNAYGESKRAGEQLLERYGRETGGPIYIYRFTNVFGKWCRPDYNSVIATFCHRITRGLPIRVDDGSRKLRLAYVEDVVDECVALLKQNREEKINNPLYMDTVYEITLGEIAKLLYGFENTRETKYIPNMGGNGFSKKLYSTYLSYLPEERLKYPVTAKADGRGSFTELFRTEERGQFSLNITKPGNARGEHWHHTKNEKFIVISGRGRIRLRQIHSNRIIDFPVSGEKIEVVDIPPGYSHDIVNDGASDLLTLIWTNEVFQPQRPDTYSMKVVDE